MTIVRTGVQALVFAISSLALTAQAVDPTGIDADSGGIDAGVRAMFKAYGTAYPDIKFVHLHGPDDRSRINALITSLGQGAANVDYEHPPQARETLLDAQVGRIGIMLAEGSPSATLFKTGLGTAITTPYVCVVTLDTDLLTGDAESATRFFLDDLSATEMRIDNEHFLYFALDHEVFHCLDAYVNGPTRPRTASKVTACYYDSRAEQRADFYAALGHRLRNPTSDGMIENLAVFRTMAVPVWDLPHYTAPALFEALGVDRASIVGLDLRERVEFAMRYADGVIMSAERYRDFVAAAVEVSVSYGSGEAAFSPLSHELASEARRADKVLVKNLALRVREAKRRFAAKRLSRN